MNIQIEIISREHAEVLCRKITADLPEYFGLPEVNAHYLLGILTRHSLAANFDGHFIGLLTLEFPYSTNCNIYWMGVLKNYHNKGVGKRLLDRASVFAKENGANTMTLETLSPKSEYKNYLRTYKFYQTNGFSPLFDLKPQNYKYNMV